MLGNVYLAGGMRTPFGSLGGSLSSLTAAQLGSLAIRASIARAGIEPAQVDEVFFGNVIGAGVGQNIARQAALGAGLPISTGATTINKVCGSAMRAIIHAGQAIQCGDLQLAVAGGCESMTNAPYLLSKARAGYRMGHGELTDSMIRDGLWDVYTDRNMGSCGDKCAVEYNFSREEQDDFAVQSYSRAIKSWDEGFFTDTVVPVEVTSRRRTVMVERDEDLGKFKGEEKLRALKPAFGPESMVTAGNASGLSDGAAATIVFGDEKKDELGLTPTARILGHANVAMESDWFTIAPIYAIRKLCEKLGVAPGEVDLFEINEAFAVVALVAIRELKLDPARVNVAGGSVAIGHPIGATGTRIVNTLVHALQVHKKKLGIACLCIGGGEASALAVERYE